MWYIGTANVTTNSVEVIGDANVDFVNNVEPGDAFICTSNGLTLEVLRAESRNKLVLARPYTGPTGSFAFSVQPTQDFNRVTANAIIDLRNTYNGYRDTILQGIFPSGTTAAPGVRGLNDQDTGLRWLGDNRLAFTSGGTDRAVVGPDGLSVSGRMDLRSTIAVANPNNGPDQIYIAQDFYSPSGSLVGRIAAVQATGTFVDAGQLALCTARGGVATEQVRVMDTGNIGIGLTAPTSRLDVAMPGAGTPRVRVISYGDEPAIDFWRYTGSANLYYGGRIGMNLDALCFYNAGGAAVGAGAWNERMRLDGAGNLLVGVTSGGNHRIVKPVGEGVTVLSIGNASTNFIFFNSVASQQWSNAATAMSVGRHSGNGRSINAGGTVNTSGADYAEYEAKAVGCGAIAAGDVCGMDRHGQLTDRWSEAVVFRIKSTNPSMVGGDTWSVHLGPRPQDPGAEPTASAAPGPAPVAPVAPGPEPTEEGPAYVDWLQARFTYAVQLGEYETALASWQAATIAYPAARAQFEADHAAWVAATAAYDRDLPIYEAALEAERQKVDRIAYCGKVPVNMTDPVEPGDYLIAAQDGERIKAVAVKEADMTFALYTKRIGRVLFVRDGRPWVDVQHG